MAVNGNALAIAITLREGKKVSLPIGQVKEVVRLVQRMLAQHTDEEILAWARKGAK